MTSSAHPFDGNDRAVRYTREPTEMRWRASGWPNRLQPSKQLVTVISTESAHLLGDGSLVRSRIRKVVAYSAKLGRHRDVDDGVNLFTVLPTSSLRSEPDRPEAADRRDRSRARDARHLRVRAKP
jgi:hypothetical protein